ncbi:hypothetical protein [Micromonospora sp. NPDC001898]|uniref:Phosphoadenosine phosphosulfate reductase n=1 Tax=Micromonospora rubida TaxID=2697657 RepID=A0ABW7SH57_9ACTN
MRYLSDFKRAAVPGSRWMCINRTFPMVSGLRTITGGKTVLHYDAVKADGATIRNGRLEWPKSAECRIDGDSVHFLPGGSDTDRISHTWTLLSDDAPADALRPPRFIAAHPLNRDHRGPNDTPWCIFDTERARVVSTAGPDTDGDGRGAYFATQADAETAIAKLPPPADPEGTTAHGWGVTPPAGDWAYEVDDPGVVYGAGPWPFHWEGRLASVRLAPNTTYQSWSHEYVTVWPGHIADQASTDLNLFVRKQGMNAMIWRCHGVTFDLLADTFTVPDRCPPSLRGQAEAKAQRILNLILAARAERDTYVRPWTAHERYNAERAAENGDAVPCERERREQPLPVADRSLPTEVHAVRQGDDFWQRVGPDEWLSACRAGVGPRPCFHRHETPTMLLFGPATTVPSWPVEELQRIAAALVGQQVTMRAGIPGADGTVLHVQHAEGGFLYGKVEHPARWATAHPLVAVHLTETRLLPDRPHSGMTDRAGQPIAVGDQVNEYTSGRIGPEPAGQLVGAFQESPSRAKRIPYAFNAAASNKTRRHVWDWYPVHHWTEEQVWAQIRESELPWAWPHDAGMSRLSCSLCVLGSKKDLLTAVRLRPGLAREYARVETDTGHSFQQARTIASLLAEAGVSW